MRPIRTTLAMLSLLGLLVGSLAHVSETGLVPVAQGAQERSTGTALMNWAPAGPVVVRLHVESRDLLSSVAGELDIWEVHQDRGYVVAMVTPEQYAWLEGLGYRLEVDGPRTEALGIQAPLDPRFHYFDDDYTNPNGLYIVDFLHDVNAAYPGLTEMIDIGDAWQGENGGYVRDMWVLRISNEDPAYGPIEEKPAFFLFANVHAREVATPELAMRYIRYLTEGYGGEGGYGIDPDVTWLVDWNVAYVLVMQNPDGHRVDEEDTSTYRRKNMDNDDGCGLPGSWGVDLNRNHSFLWGCCGGSSGEPCAETYRGPSRGSEPETQAFETFFASVFEDQNGPNGEDEIPPAAPITTTGIFVSLHSYSDLVLWPWGPSFPAPPPNAAELEEIGRKLAYYTTYEPAGEIGYDVDGATDYWVYGMFGIPAYTFEVGPYGGDCGYFFPAYDCIDGYAGRSFWDETRPAFLYAHRIARTPYLTAYGPDTEGVVAVPGVIEPEQPVLLQATVADHRYTGDPLRPVAGAEYFINSPGQDGAGIPLQPADGDWGDLAEVVSGTVDTTGLGLGRHYLLVHGQNDNGEWGPFSAVFLYVLDPGVAPVIEGTVRDAITLLPLGGTVRAGPFQAFSDPASGYYSMTVLSGTYEMSAVAPGYAITTTAGVQARNYEVVQQDFALYPTCQAFADDAESGSSSWTTTGLWHISTQPDDPCAQPHSGSASWYYGREPQCDYAGAILGGLTTAEPIDLSGAWAPVTLRFWSWEQVEPDETYDIRRVLVSADGQTWTEAWTSENNGASWVQVELDVSAYAGGDLYLRFEFDAVDSLHNDYRGWYVDDIEVRATGPVCLAPLAPAAEFASNSPILLGQTAVFTNLTGSPLPVDFRWAFGDGITSTVEHPTHTYAVAGLYTATLTATNAAGSDRAGHPLYVVPTDCVGLSAVTIEGPTAGPAGLYTFTASYEPADATWPIWFLWDNGDAGSVSIRFLEAATHTLTVTAANCLDALAFDTHEVVVEGPGHTLYLPLILRGTEGARFRE